MATHKNKKIDVVVNSLEFDRQNPRLVSLNDLSDANDITIMCALASEADIGELVSSIIANTYMNIEPLIVTKKDTLEKGNYRVLEGNRRLAAIRFIQQPDLAKKCRVSIPENIPQKVFNTLTEVSAYEVENEEESRAFIGFKHINGPHRWESYAKARFLTDWYEREYANGITIEDIAIKLGDQNQTVRQLISGMLVLKQAEDSELFEISDRTKPGKFGFSHLYTALGRLEYRKFLGLKKDWNHRPNINPISTEEMPRLKETLQYLYGSKKDEMPSLIKSQNPDLKRLGMVLAHPAGLENLRVNKNLDLAEEQIKPAGEVFNSALIIAHSKVQDCFGKVSKFDPDKSAQLISYAQELTDNAINMLMLMKAKLENKSNL